MITISLRRLLAGITLASCASMISCGSQPHGESSTTRATSAAQRKVFVYGGGGDAVGLDPAREDDGESFKVCDNIYDTLVQYAEETTEIEPGLAESWEISADGLTYTFHLRKAVQFHDGAPLNANAVVFSFRRQGDAAHPFHHVGGPYKYWGNMNMSRIIASIDALDELTVRFTLTVAEAPFLADLAMSFASIVSPAAVEKWGAEFSRHPVGTGPFQFVEWVKDDRIVLDANPSYWGGRPKLDRIVFRAIPDSAARYLELRTGTLSGMDFPNPDDLPKIRADASLQVLEQPGMNVGYLAMNTQKSPFDDVRVRRAVNFAVNKQAIVDHLYAGMGMVANGPLPPGMIGYAADIRGYDYDLETARKLLAEAGKADGFATTLWAMPVPRPYMPNGMRVAQAVQADLAKVGIRAEIVTYEWGTYLDKTDHGEHDMALLGWSGDNGDPDNFLYVLLDQDAAVPPATNIAFFKNATAHELLVAAKRKTDPRERAELYRQAQKIIHDEAPWVPLAHAVQVAVLRAEVSGFKLHPTTKRRFLHTDLRS
ncbi:MAG: ABC transporter substrate-binding protein [Candidatus Schekmanbacteria bacterium]|nr:ABC transporter substrate-binding protein [Candidatus Schekmanbacteria bacterium]